MKTCIALVTVLLMTSCHDKSSYTLRWKTANEFRNFGFDIYRSQNMKGPFEKITESPILGAGTSDLINEYVFKDINLKKSQVYYYYIESISEDGKRKRFSPIKSVAINQ